jgi:hypothetical protein
MRLILRGGLNSSEDQDEPAERIVQAPAPETMGPGQGLMVVPVPSRTVTLATQWGRSGGHGARAEQGLVQK